MTTDATHSPRSESDEDSRRVAEHILQRLGEGGQPPDFGITRMNVGNESYLRVLEHEYFKRHLRHGASFKLVQGYFGGGKTHFLYCVRDLAWRYGFATAVVELSPAECPYDDSLKVYQAVVRRLSLKPERAFGAMGYGLCDLLRRVVDGRLGEGVDASSASAPGRAEVEAWLRRDVGRANCESHSYRQATVGFCLAYLRGDEALESALEGWLRGEAVPASAVREAGVYDGITKSNAFTMLRCLAQMVVALGLAGTVLLFDEVDRTLSVSARRSQIIGDSLRHVIDLCGRHELPNTLFAYAVPPEFMRNIVPEYPALYQRLKSPMPLSVRSPQAVLIDLEVLDLEPEALLFEIGRRLIDVFEEARDISLDRSVQEANARALARACAEAYFEVNHRRLFVKTWVDFLFHQLVDGARELSSQEAVELVLSGYDGLGAGDPAADDDFADF